MNEHVNGSASADNRASADEGKAFLAENPDIESVDLLIGDLNGVMRGKWAPAEALEKVCQPGINLPLSIFGLDIWGREVESTGLHIETGDRDGFCKAIPTRISRAPWAPRPTAQALMTMFTETGTPYHADPRNALVNVVARLKEKGLTAVTAFELEFYLVDPTAFQKDGRMSRDQGNGPDPQNMYSLAELRGQNDLFAEIRTAAIEQGLPIDTIIKEAAPGQFEVNLKHSADPLRAADDVIHLKRLILGCARAHGLTATFMAKPFLEFAGNGMHIHASMLDDRGVNIFSGEEGKARLRHAIAGLIRTMPESLLLFINTWNGFRRITPGSYAPTRAVWAENNRSVALRIPASNDANRRLEHRISGADANPYLVLCAVLQGMLEGIEAGAEPPPPVEGNAYDNTEGAHLPDDMDEALQLMQKGQFVERALGPALAKVYKDLKRTEILAFWGEITPLERTTYL